MTGLEDQETENGLQVGVHGCPNGCVCLTFGATSVHLPPEQFVRFMAMASEALERMVPTTHRPARSSDGPTFQ